ncbi:MAG: hypothetical protein QE263_02905 [Vampirovibrionales bacterium]|nr:hypothetical protein [Vampirovibrionales bacterium]
MTVSSLTAFQAAGAKNILVAQRFGAVFPAAGFDSVQFGSANKNEPLNKKVVPPPVEFPASNRSRVWAGVKLAAFAGLGFVFAGPIGAALGGITMMDMVWGLVVPTLLEEGAESKAFTKVKEGLGKLLYNPLKARVTKIGNGWIGRRIFKVQAGNASEWAAQKLSGIDPARLHEVLANRAKNKTANKGLAGSLMNLKNHFKSLQKDHGMQWAEAMTHTVYSGLVIARNRMTIKGFWTGLRNEFKQGVWKGCMSLFTRRFWSNLRAFKNGFSIFRMIKSLLIGNVVLRLATEALHSAATLFLGKGRWEQIRKDHDHKIDPLDDKLESTEAATKSAEEPKAPPVDEPKAEPAKETRQEKLKKRRK